MNEFTGSAASQADFIWKNAEDLWGDFKHTDFGKIILGKRIKWLILPLHESETDRHLIGLSG
ncbi:hypothetical protein RVO95_27155 [Klebsiella michiganensis]|nr:hypothetical protein [Klebsiella michiganensis]MDV0374663.1 hypothetical protein [Klebsiella michiganensis]